MENWVNCWKLLRVMFATTQLEMVNVKAIKNNINWMISSQDHLGISGKVQRLVGTTRSVETDQEFPGTLCNRVCDIVRSVVKATELSVNNSIYTTYSVINKNGFLEQIQGQVLGNGRAVSRGGRV